MAAPDTPTIRAVCPPLAGKLTGSVQGMFRLWEVFDERVLRGSEIDLAECAAPPCQQVVL